MTQGIFKTTQDFLIYNWWKTTGQTNVIFRKATMSHDLQNKFYESLESRIKNFFSKMSEYTKELKLVYFWSNSPRVREKVVPEAFQKWTKNKIVKNYNDIVGNDLLNIMTKELKSRMNVGLDLYKLSESLKPSAYVDAVHHKPE